jgi:hypothetical protein
MRWAGTAGGGHCFACGSQHIKDDCTCECTIGPARGYGPGFKANTAILNGIGDLTECVEQFDNPSASVGCSCRLPWITGQMKDLGAVRQVCPRLPTVISHGWAAMRSTRSWPSSLLRTDSMPWVQKTAVVGWVVRNGHRGAEGAIQTGAPRRSAILTTCCWARAASTSGPTTRTGLLDLLLDCYNVGQLRLESDPAVLTLRLGSKPSLGRASAAQSS